MNRPRGRPIRRSANRALAVTLAVLLAVVAVRPSDPAAAGSSNFRTFQHNIKLIFSGAINYITVHDPPLLITGQEFCRQGYEDMKAALEGGRGYRVVGIATVPSSSLCSGRDGQINLVASRGTLLENPLRGHFPTQASGDGSNRGYACLSSGAYLLAWWVCSTHLTSRTAAAATAQANEMRNVAFWINDRAVIVGGDFNRTPGQSGPAAWYNSFFESDQTNNSFTFNADVTPTKKIDYMFSIALRTDAAFGVARVGCTDLQTGSDHCFVHGTHRFLW